MTGCDVSTYIYHLSYKTHQYICDLTSRNKKTTIKETATARHRKEKQKFILVYHTSTLQIISHLCYIHVIRLYDHIKCKLIKFSQVFSDISFIFLILKIILALFIVSATFFEKCYYKSPKKHLNYQVQDQTVLIICFSALSNLETECM